MIRLTRQKNINKAIRRYTHVLQCGTHVFISSCSHVPMYLFATPSVLHIGPVLYRFLQM